MNAWEIYLDELRSRGAAADRQPFGRAEGLEEAAHDAYRATTDRLTRNHGWADERALVVMRGLNAGVREWLRSDDRDWERLGRELERRERELRDGFGPEP